MGLGYTLQELSGWRGQYASILRWHARVHSAANGDPSADEMDFLLTFFVNCFSLRDWLLEGDVVSREDVTLLFKQNPELRLCRDIANGFKHMKLNDPSVDARFSILNEYVPKNWPGAYRYPNGKWIIFANDKKKLESHRYGLVELTDRCMVIWSDFLGSKSLL